MNFYKYTCVNVLCGFFLLKKVLFPPSLLMAATSSNFGVD